MDGAWAHLRMGVRWHPVWLAVPAVCHGHASNSHVLALELPYLLPVPQPAAVLLYFPTVYLSCSKLRPGAGVVSALYFLYVATFTILWSSGPWTIWGAQILLYSKAVSTVAARH